MVHGVHGGLRLCCGGAGSETREHSTGCLLWRLDATLPDKCSYRKGAVECRKDKVVF